MTKSSELQKNGSQNDVISKMFLSASIAMIFTLFVGTAAGFFDGIITSRYLGKNAYSGVSLFGPLSGMFLMLVSFLSSGNQILCSGFIGEGKKDKANSLFTFCLLAGLGVSLLLMLLCVLLPDPLIAFCGVTKAGKPELYVEMRAYMQGYMLGLPALFAVQIIGPMVVLDNGKLYFTVSAFVLCAVDIAGDLINALVLHGGTFGMGVATAVSYTIQLVMLVAFLLRKDSFFRFSLKAFRRKGACELTKNGSPSLVQSLAFTLRDFSINRLNLLFAVSTAAIVARGIQYDFNMVLFCIADGIAYTMLSMAGIYHSVSDRVAMKRLFTYGIRVSALVALGTSALVFLLSPLIVGFYTTEPESAALSVFAIRWMAVSLLVDIPLCVFMNYLRGIRLQKIAILLNILDRLVFPVGAALALSFFFGSKGLLVSVALGKLLLAISVFVVICARNKGIPKSVEELMMLPEDFGGRSQENLYGNIRTMEDVVIQTRRTEEFCLLHGADDRTAFRMALFMEEMASNIVQHGNPGRRKKALAAEYRLFIHDDRICLTLRDYNRAFDPTAWYHENHETAAPGEGAGIRMVMGLAEETCYFNAFSSNNLLIWLKNGKAPSA